MLMMVMKKNCILLFGLGVVLGFFSKLFDLYTTNLGNLFSELSIWILIGVIITIYSKSRKRAMIHIFLFCIGMLISYYLTAYFTSSVYSKTFIIGWSVFACLSPFFSCLTWEVKKKNFFSLVISVGILIVTILASVILFDGPRWYDYGLFLFLIYLLFIKKKKT